MLFSHFVTKNVFTLLHQNIQSILNKIDIVEATLKDLQDDGKYIDVLCLTETFIKKGNENNLKLIEFKLANFFSRDSEKRGGSAILVRRNIKFKPLPICNELSCSHAFECCGIEVLDLDLLIINIYRVPKSAYEETFLNRLETLLRSLVLKRSKKKIIVCGDWNVDILKKNTTAFNLLSILRNNNFHPHILVPTRGSSCLDQIATNMRNVTSDVHLLGLSDHETAQSITFKIKTVRSSQVYYVERRDYSKHNMQKFRECLSKLSFSDVMIQSDTNEAFREFNELILLFHGLCFPFIKIKISNRNRKVQWLSKGIRRSCVNKRTLYLKYKQTASNKTINKNNYCSYSKLLRKCITKAQQIQHKKYINNAQNKCIASWNVINGNKESKRQQIDLIEHDGVRYTDPTEIVELFNNYFIDITNQSKKRTNNDKYNPNSIPMNLTSIYLGSCDESEILKIILSLKNSKSSGYDGISTKIVKYCALYLCKPISHIVNLSFSQGKFPEALKLSIIKPLFKKDDCTIINNFRPVAVPSTYSKIIEKAMYRRLLNFVTKHRILNQNQFGFRKNSSTTLACFKLIKDVTESLNCKVPIVSVYLDMSKAFDFVDHNILLNKLYRYGIRGVAFDWIKSYLQDRKQCTEIQKIDTNNLQLCTYTSSPKNNNFGVPQGSILGPLLFLTYINDLPNCLDHTCIMFADDITLIVKCNNLNSFNDDINNALSKIYEWLLANNLNINYKKTNIMQFGTYRSNDIILDINCNSNKIDAVQVTKFLGFYVDKHCDWKAHIENVCQRVDKFIYVLRKLSRTASMEVSLMAYHGYVSSILSYGLLLWGNSVDAKKVFIVQKKCIRAIFRAHHMDSCRPLFKSRKLLPLFCLYIKQLCLLVREHPDYFKLNGEIYQRSTRYRDELYKPPARLDLYKRNSYIMAICVYNHLPSFIKTCPSPKFKQVISGWLMDKCYYSLTEYFNDKL